MKEEFSYLIQMISQCKEISNSLKTFSKSTPDLFTNPFQSTTRRYEKAAELIDKAIKELQYNENNLSNFLYK